VQSLVFEFAAFSPAFSKASVLGVCEMLWLFVGYFLGEGRLTTGRGCRTGLRGGGDNFEVEPQDGTIVLHRTTEVYGSSRVAGVRGGRRTTGQG